MADLPRLNNIIRALEAGQHALTTFAPAEINSAIAMSASKYDACVFEMEHNPWDGRLLRDCLQYMLNRAQIAKAGLVHMTRVLARALAPAIRVNAIVPGHVLPPENWEDEDHADGRDRVLTARSGEPRDVVAALLYLLEGDFLTGEVLVVDGGRRLL